MNVFRIITVDMAAALLLSCANNQTATSTALQTDTVFATVTNNAPDSFPTQTIIEHVACRNDATQSYALYIPFNNKNNTVIYFFDPHADGALPLKKYKALADAYNYILIGSNNSKNGNDFSMAETIWQNIFNDTQQRLLFDKNKIYVCGFSGGAKVASYLALHHPEIKSVIAGGAGLPDETPPASFNFSFTGIAGKGDMNMTDLVALNNAFNKTQTNHRLILFNGKHEWAPPSTMNIAFAGLQFDAMRNKQVNKNDSLINAFISYSKKRIDSCIKKNEFIQASNECTLAINMLNEIADVDYFKQKNNSIIGNTAYKNQLLQQQKIFLTEENTKAIYNAQFQSGDVNYWTKTIADLNTKAKGTTPEAAMNQRLLAYLSLAFYSISNQLITNNQNKAEYFVSLYKMADPTNSEAWYFSAVINARNSNAAATTNDLLKAVDNGFNDDQRMRQQQEFQNLQPALNFAAIEAKMKNPS